MKVLINLIAIITGLIFEFANFAVAFYVGIGIYNVLEPIAAAERGCTGVVGGEALVAVVAGTLTYYIVRRIIYFILDMVSDEK